MSSADKQVKLKPRFRRLAVALVVIAAVGVAGWLLLTRDATEDTLHFTGYVISDNIYMSSPIAGTVASVSVKRGQQVKPGTPLFHIDATSLEARADKAKAQIQQAQSQRAVRQADLESIQATLKLATADLDRLLSAQTGSTGSVSQKEIDKARETVDKATANSAAAQNLIAAAESDISSANASLVDIARQVVELSAVCPVSGRIEEVMFKPGEWVAANAAVISIVPDDEVKVRFYVPQRKMHLYSAGTQVAIAFDGGPSGMTATVDFVATRPEYTPPIIYSIEARDKLVFMVEAVPAEPGQLIPGQPIDITPIVVSDKTR